MLLSQVQNYLAGFYEAPTPYDIYDFLITDPAHADALTPPGQRDNAERLLVAQTDDGVELSVYVDGDTLRLLHDDDPFIGLHDGNLGAFMLALEGVSHFHYLCWNASFDKSVTLLELELQAEVDKYITALALLGEQANTAGIDDVHERLFENVRFRDELSADHRTRYQDANRYAGKYCRSLLLNYPEAHREPCFRNELRRFYRLTQNEKIRRIESAS